MRVDAFAGELVVASNIRGRIPLIEHISMADDIFSISHHGYNTTSFRAYHKKRAHFARTMHFSLPAVTASLHGQFSQADAAQHDTIFSPPASDISSIILSK